MVEALRKRFGHDMTSIAMVPGQLKPRNSAMDKLATMGRARKLNVMKGGDKVKAPVGDYHRVTSIRPGPATLGSFIVFKEGSAELTEQHKRVLEATALEFGGKPQRIEISGHTSLRPLPDDSPYRDKWDLSHVRCHNVMEYLVKTGIDPKRFQLVSAADNEPKHLHDPLLRKDNPRVEVVMLSELVTDWRGTSPESQQGFSTEGAP